MINATISGTTKIAPGIFHTISFPSIFVNLIIKVCKAARHIYIITLTEVEPESQNSRTKSKIPRKLQ